MKRYRIKAIRATELAGRRFLPTVRALVVNAQ
jgi:hypothetical protein